MNVVKLSLVKNGNENLSKNFKVREFACQDGSDEILIDLDMIPILQTIRDVGGKVTINSAYRTLSHNKRVGGATNSYHTKGRAFDIVSEYLTVDEVCDLANTLGVKGIIRYPTFVHIDSRTNQYHADNNGRKMAYGLYEQIALDYLVKAGRITDKKKWEDKLGEVKWLIMKWTKDVKALDKLGKIN